MRQHPTRARRLATKSVVLGGLLCLTGLHGLAALAPQAGASLWSRLAGFAASEPFLLINAAGLYLFLLVSAVLDRRAGEAVTGARDLSAETAEMAKLAVADELTGLPTRRCFEHKLENVLEASRAGGRPPSVALVELDGFKPINDVYGLSAGDEILRQVALRLDGVAARNGSVARIGGEFGLIAPEIRDEAGARSLGGMLSYVLSAPYDVGRRNVRLSGSLGFAYYPDSACSVLGLLEQAEVVLSKVEQDAKGRIAVFSRTLEESLRERAKIEHALRCAIAGGSVRPHFQPIVDLETETILGFEALARWHDEELGQVSPTKFIPIAEESGLITELTDMLLHLAASEAKTWPGDVFMSFNLSTAQLADPVTGLKILSIVSGAGLDPCRLDIEITETAAMSDPNTALEIITALRRAGVRMALDDFGTGHSNLSYLRQLTVDKVKIDRSFVMGIGRERQSEHIVKAILEMCAGLELKVVAEGIEERGQVLDLRRFGCRVGQGYLFGRPMDGHAARDLIRNRPSLRCRAAG